MPELTIRTDDLRWLCGKELVRKFELPVRSEPPGYSRVFCGTCGCLVPDPDAAGEWMGIPAGALDDDPGIEPERHIFIEHKAGWYEVHDGLPQLDEASLRKLRAAAGAHGEPEA
jgi:hypothetical protein